MLRVLECAEADDLIVLPEGALSGYAEDPAFLKLIDVTRLKESQAILSREAIRRNVHLIFGSCVEETGRWFNTGIYYGPNGEEFIYRKINLVTNERRCFTAGPELKILKTTIGMEKVGIGIQLCREIRFPEQWRYLARAGADIFVYLANAVGDGTGRNAEVWRSHLVSRGAENQRFVLGANNAAEGQKCPSMIVSPEGTVLWETLSASLEMKRCEIDLSEVSNWYLNQSRDDMIQSSL